MNRILIRNLSTAATNMSSANNIVAAGKRLTGKVAVVTASTDGIGLAIAQRLASDGASVVISSRKAANVERAVAQLHAAGLPNVLGVQCHVGSRAERSNLFAQAVSKFGGVDILVSNAAVSPAVGPVLDAAEEAWDKIFEINVKAAFLLAQEARPLIQKRGGGNIVFVSSIAGFNPFSLLGAYSVSKSALLGLTKAVAQDLAPENIRVNCVAPGIIKTAFSKALYESQTAYEHAISTVPLGRLGESPEIAGVVAFLVSDDASYITGETIVSAGGMTSRL